MAKTTCRLLLVTLLLAGCSSGAPLGVTSPPAAETTPFSSPLPEAQPQPTPASQVPAPADCPATLTPAQMEGPYYTPGSPERPVLVEPGIPGEPLLVTGVVMNSNCEPIAGARVDFWQADGAGEYDNTGYQLRGHQFTGPDGSYHLETVIPGVYSGRTPHIHVKIFASDGRELLTTQLYLAGISEQIPDSLFNAALLARDEEPDPTGRRHISFDFVVGE